jgi:acetylxylan esterase
VFAAGIAYAGVPATCFYTGTVDGWNNTCSQGQLNLSQEYWAGKAKGSYPGYTGPRPRMRIHHGTADTTLYPQNYYETIKQWTGVFGYSTTAVATYPNDPASPYTRYVFGPNVEGVLGTVRFIFYEHTCGTGYEIIRARSGVLTKVVYFLGRGT